MRFDESRDPTVKVQLTSLKRLLQQGQEFAAKQAAQNTNGEKEAVTGTDPPGVIHRDPSGGDDAVYVSVMVEILPPGM